MNEERLLDWAERIGPSTVSFVERVIASRTHPQQAYRSCLGVLRLGKKYGDDRLEGACHRAVTLGSYSFKSVDAILKNRLDERPLEAQQPATLPKVRHTNVRGGTYYAAACRARDEDEARRNAC